MGKAVDRLFKAWNELGLERPPETIADFGANVGDLTRDLFNVSPTSKFYCYEPISSNFERLKERFAGRKNINLFNHGIWSETVKKNFGISKERESSNIGLFSVLHPEGQLVEEVNLVDIRELEIRPEMLKIDIEGSEFEIFSVAESFLANTRVLQYEHLPVGHANYFRHNEIPDILTSYGFRQWSDSLNHNLIFVK